MLIIQEEKAVFVDYKVKNVPLPFAASFFHELWKRKQAEIGYDWDVAEFEQEEVSVTSNFDYHYRYSFGRLVY